MSYTYIKAWKTSSSSFLENQKRGEEEKSCQMWGNLVCCTLLLCSAFSPPCCLPEGKEEHPLCGTGVLTTAWGTGQGWVTTALLFSKGADGHLLPLLRGWWWCSRKTFYLETSILSLRAGEAQTSRRRRGRKAACPLDRMLRSGLKAWCPSDCDWEVILGSCREKTSRIAFN